MDQQGHKTGGRRKGRPNNRTLKRNEAAAETVALIGELIPDAFPGDAHAFLVAVYKDPRVDGPPYPEGRGQGRLALS